MNAPDQGTEESRRTDRFSRLSALFDQAADLPPDEQQALLDAECGDDPVLRAEVEQLLADDARLGAPEPSFLRSPVIRAADEPTDPATPSPRPESVLPSHLGRYRLIRLIGEGGMGAVYEAEQDSPRRTVALKVVRPGLASASLLKRFRHESQLLGRLHHPGIAQVYDAGLAADGQPFFAMEFIRGLPLNEYARVRALTLPARLELLARVCDAVQHAHDHGIIHRDLKPANILVEETGQPKVLDFGVARATDSDLLTAAGLTQTGQLLGTPNFMSPEQVTGEPAAIDRRADVYALGVILFELGTHRLPYQLENRSLAETVRAILEEDPPRAGSLNPGLRGDVETIVAKALEKDRARRYASAADMAADIRRYLGHEPILARPPSSLYQLGKFARRHRALVGGVLATVAALVVGLVGTIIFAVAEARQRGEAEKNLTAANQEKREAQHQAYRATLVAADGALQNNDVADAARLLNLSPKTLRGWEWRHLSSRLDDSSAVVAYPGGFARLVIGAPGLQPVIGHLTSAGMRITDVGGVEQRIVPIAPKHRQAIGITQTRRGLRVAAWVDVMAFDLLDETGNALCRVAAPESNGSRKFGVVVSPDSTRLAYKSDAAGNAHWITVVDVASGKKTPVQTGQVDFITSFQFSPDSSLIALASENMIVRVCDAATGAPRATCLGHTGAVRSVDFSPDGARLVTASSDGTVRQWDAETGREIERPYDRHRALMRTAVYSPDGQSVASAGEDRTIRVWRARGLQDVAVLHGHTTYVEQLVFAPDGRHLVSRNNHGTVTAPDDWVRVWNVSPDATVPVLRGHTSEVYPLGYSPDGRWLASGSWDKTVRVWDAATGEHCATLLHSHTVEGLAFVPDGTWLVTACNGDDRLRVWDVATARVGKEIPCDITSSVAVTVSPDGTRVAVRDFSWDTTAWRLRVFDLATGKPLFTTGGMSLAYSPDGRWLAATAADHKTVLLLDARTHETAARFSGHENDVFKAAFSPDGRRLASCSKDHTVRLWSVPGDELQAAGEAGSSRSSLSPPPSAVLKGHTDQVYAVAFHPDGTRLATAARDGAVCLWDVARGEELVRLRGHEQFVWSLAFSPDGATLASCSGDHTVRLWDTAPLKTRYQARHEADALRPDAERLVEQLWRTNNDPTKVADALRADRALGEPLRHAALRALMLRAQPPTLTRRQD